MDADEIARLVEARTGRKPYWPAVEPTPRWVRVKLGTRTIADSKRALLVIQYGSFPLLPTYFFPREDIAVETLVEPVTAEDGSIGWTVEADGCRALGGAWTHAMRTGVFAKLEGMVTFDWFGELQWFEEDERVFIHARDPYKRIDVMPSSREVSVALDGVVLARSARPHLLFETLLPTRYYLPVEDVRVELLPSDTRTQCPYKGEARYWSVVTGTAMHDDIAWSYDRPVPELPRIRQLICFFNEKVDLTVDGKRQERFRSPWSDY